MTRYANIHAVAIIAVVAAGLRIAGLSWGLPYALHPDEGVILERVGAMAWDNLNPGFFIYPGFFLYQVFALDRLVAALGGEQVHLILAARFLTAAYSLATVGFAYLIGARLAGRRTGLTAAALCAFSGALVLHAHYAVTDTPATALATAVVWWSVRAWQRRSYGEMISAAALAGLAVSTKYSVAPVCFVPWLGAMALAAGDGATIARRLRATALLATVSVGAFLATSPYTLIDFRTFLDDMAVESHLQARGRAGYHIDELESPGILDRGWLANTTAAARDLGLPAALIAGGVMVALLGSVPGTIRAAATDPEQTAAPPASFTGRLTHDPVGAFLVGAWIVLYFGFMAPSALGGQRYVLPIYPALTVLAACGIGAAVRFVNRPGRHRRALAVGIVLLVLAAGPPLTDAVAKARLLAQPDTRLVARAWITDNLERRSHLAREFYSPPIHTADDFRLSQPFSLTEHPLETYCAEAVDYLVLSSLNRERYFAADDQRFADERAWYDRLAERTRLVHRIDGTGGLELHHPTIEVRRLFCRDS